MIQWTSSNVLHVRLYALFPQVSPLTSFWLVSPIAICTRHQSDSFKWRFRCWWISQKTLREKQVLSDVIFRFRCYYTVILSLYFFVLCIMSWLKITAWNLYSNWWINQKMKSFNCKTFNTFRNSKSQGFECNRTRRKCFPWRHFTLWKVSKYGVFSGPYFPVFGLNAQIYFVIVCIQSEYRKIGTRKNSVFGYFSRSAFLLKNKSRSLSNMSQKSNGGVNKETNNINMKLLWNKEISIHVQQFFLFPSHIFGTLQVLKLSVSWDWLLVHFKQLGGVHQTHLPLHLLNLKILTCYGVETCNSNAPW